MGTVEKKVWECDNPKCKTVIVDPDNGDPILGFHIDVSHHFTTGGLGISGVFACRESCIRPAIVHALDKAWRE